MKKRLLCLLLICTLMVPLLVQTASAAQDATKQDTTRVIGIVFDNSGSMYEYERQGIESWCRATYAMEVFASMMNESDQLQIYPMHPITLGKGNSNKYDRNKPLVINGPAEAEKIREIYSPDTFETPFDTVKKAYEGLKKSTADEKYLIVLTDGTFTDFDLSDAENLDDEEKTVKITAEVSKNLAEYSKDMNVMFLGIGDVMTPKVTDSSTQYYTNAPGSSEVLSKLTEMCNRIFGRDILNVSGKKVNFDVSMSKLILFVQGKNVSDVKLSGGTEQSEHVMKYSELGRGKQPFAIDRSLQGMIVTYSDLDAGAYDLSYSGDVTSISVYYEPDVDLEIKFLDENGKEVDPGSEELSAGTYTLTYRVVDKNDNPTDSDLLGEVDYDITYTINGQEYHIEDDENGAFQIALNPGDELDAEFSVNYLNNYSIRKDGEALGWPSGSIKIPRPVSDFRIEVSGGQNEYALSKLEQQGVYNVTVYYEGNRLVGEALNSVQFDFGIQGGNTKHDIQQTEDGYTVSLKYNGDAAGTQCVEQSGVFSAGYTNSDGQTGRAADVEQKFTIKDDSKLLDIELKLAQDYYVIKDISESEPIIANVTFGGEPLTAEQFEAAKVDIQIPGLEYDVQPDPENSRYIVTLKNNGKVEPGKHDVSCTVSGTDSIGRPSTGEDTDKIELQNYPRWVRTLFWILVILAILAAIWGYMNMKVLPKRITTMNSKFTVGGKEVPGSASCNYTGANKKKGSLVIKSPRYASDSALKCGMTLELVAESPRRVPSAQRKVRVVGITPSSKSNTTKMQVGATALVKNADGKFVKQGTRDTTKVECSIANNTAVSVNATILSPVKGKKVAVSLSNVRLKFR